MDRAGAKMKRTRSRGRRAFVDVNVVDVTQGVVRSHQTVVVEGDRIVSVEESSKAPLDSGTRVVSRGSGYLLPGLADLHVHLSGEADMLLFLLNGVTSVRNMWGFSRHLVWRSEIERGRLLGPTVYTTGPIIDGFPPRWNMSVPLGTTEAAVSEVRRQKAAGYSAIKVYNGLSEEIYRAVVREAGNQGLPVVGHVPDSVLLGSVLSARQRSIEHLEGWVGALQSASAPWKGRPMRPEELPRALEFFDRGLIPEVAGQMARSDSWSCPTLEVYERFASPAQVAERLSLPEMRWCPPSVIAGWDPSADFRFRNLPPSFWEGLKRIREGRREIVRALRKSGAKVLVGTDTPNPWVVPGFSLHNELDHLVGCGYSAPEVLRLATETASEFLGVAGEFGVVRPGARADLVLLEENPLLDVSRARHPRGVMARGHWLSRSELDRLSGLLLGSYSDGRRRLEGALREDRPELADGVLTYSIESFGRLVGMERIWLPSSASSATGLTARLVLDAPPGVATIDSHWELREATQVTEMKTRISCFEGDETMVVRATKGGFRVRDSTRGASGGITGRIPRSPDAIIGPVQVGSWISKLDSLRALAPGDSLRSDVIRVECECIQVAKGSVIAKREQDTDQGQATVLAIEEQWSNGDFKGRLELDTDSRIRSFRWQASTAELNRAP